MGFFDKIKAGVKNLADRVTGGYGTLTCEVTNGSQFHPGDTVEVEVRLDSTGDLKLDKLRLFVVGTETVDLDDEDGLERITCKSQRDTFREEVQLSGALALPQGQSRSFNASIQIPAYAPPSCAGANIRSSYELEARGSVDWGADLKQVVDVNVVPQPQAPERLRFEKKSPFLIIGVDCDTPCLGKQWECKVTLEAQRDLKVVRYSASLVSVEYFYAEAREISPIDTRKYAEGEDGESAPPPATDVPEALPVPREVERLCQRTCVEEKLGFSLMGPDRRWESSTKADLAPSVTVSYRTDKARRFLRLDVEVQTNTGHVALSQELPVTAP